MKNKLKISIITITLNSEKTIEETIKSIISQNYSNLEYIIIDGGSSDKTLDIVNKYSDKISKIISEQDEGISDAFNKGILHATGDVIGIINSDDMLLPGALSALEENFEPGVDVYRGNTIIWNEITKKRFRAIPTMNFSLYGFNNIVCHQSTFVSKDGYAKLGLYNKKYKYMMDIDLLIRFYRNSAIMKYINKDMAIYRLGGLTDSTIIKKLKEVEWVIVDNNGHRLLAKMKVLTWIIFQWLKKLSFFLVGKETIRKLRYSKY